MVHETGWLINQPVLGAGEAPTDRQQKAAPNRAPYQLAGCASNQLDWTSPGFDDT
jgi:hypothetical protein